MGLDGEVGAEIVRGVRRWVDERVVPTASELERAGAFRVYEDPAGMLDHLDEVGGRT